MKWMLSTAVLIGLAGYVGLTWTDGAAVEEGGEASGSVPEVKASRLTEPLDLIPRESLLCWKGLPYPDTHEQKTEESALDVGVQLIQTLFSSRLKPAQKLTLRMFEGFADVVRHRFALSLIDAHASPIENEQGATGVRGDRLKIALVVNAGDDMKTFFGFIAKVVGELTDSGTASLETKQTGRFRYQELYDERMPAWCRIAWGRIDDHFVLTFGREVWPLVASVAIGDEPALSRDAWLEARRAGRAEESLIEIIVSSKALVDRLDHIEGIEGRASAFFEAWGAEDLERAHWSLGFEQRALYCEAYFKKGDRTLRRLYADPNIRDPKFLETVTADARYAIYRVSLERVLPRIVAGLAATRSPEQRAELTRTWERIEREHGFDVENDLLANMGNTIILHNDPPHPLRIPLAVTSLYEIRKNPAQVKKTLETMCRAWQEALDADPTNPTRVVDEDDGVWYLSFPLFDGFAWTISDRFVIASWSPKALREYLGRAGDSIGKRTFGE